jgi:hypothetical protein
MIIHVGQKDLKIPESWPFPTDLISILENTSTTKLNKIGEAWSPNLTPLIASKKALFVNNFIFKMSYFQTCVVGTVFFFGSFLCCIYYNIA